jgi:hypothetical protein
MPTAESVAAISSVLRCKVNRAYLIKTIEKDHLIDTVETMDPDQDGVPD